MGRDTVQLETAVSTISQEYLLEFTSEYGILEALYPELPDMDLFNLICGPNPPKVKIGTSPYAAHKVPLLIVTASRVIEIEDSAVATDSSRVPSTIERSPLDFSNENPSQKSTGPEDQGQEVVAREVPLPPRECDDHKSHSRGKPSRMDCCRGKSLAAMGLGMGSTRPVPASRGAPVDVSDLDPQSFVDPQSRPTADVAQKRPWPEIQIRRMPCLPPWLGRPKSFVRRKLRHLHNDDILKQYNVNLEWQVVMGLQLQLRFKQEAKLLKKSVAQVAHRDKMIQARENEIKNLETLLEAETDMKKATEGKSVELSKQLENLRALLSDLQVSNNRLSQQVSTLQVQVTGEEKLKAAFEEFKQYEDNQVEQRCAEIDACLDALSIDFDEELYPHMLTAIAGHRWVIGHGLRLAVMKCDLSTELRQVFTDVVSAGIAKDMSEGLRYGVERKKANLSLEVIEAYDPEAEAKHITALYDLKDLKYPLVDQLESLKDAPMDVIMDSLHLKSDTGDDAP
uniref:Transposase (Putative), gypsy type n=1 Tax=Tanacetum cinerariifolium TaxID=118510 RepID=A0A6L2MRK8_TANCI|nr:hypothetical protein [Tanacetum cinerariifolium]